MESPTASALQKFDVWFVDGLNHLINKPLSAMLDCGTPVPKLRQRMPQIKLPWRPQGCETTMNLI